MDVPAGLGERGLALWEALSSGDVARDALALEASRLADRLDELDSIIQGKGVLNLMQFRLHLNELDEDGNRNINVEVKFAAPLAEARQQAMALSGLLRALGPSEASSETSGPVATPLDGLMKKIAERQAKKTS